MRRLPPLLITLALILVNCGGKSAITTTTIHPLETKMAAWWEVSEPAFKALQSEVSNVTREARDGISPGALAESCGHLGDAVEEMQVHLPVPDPESDRLTTAFLKHFEQGAILCEEGASESNSDKMGGAAAEFGLASTTMSQAADRVQEITNA